MQPSIFLLLLKILSFFFLFFVRRKSGEMAVGIFLIQKNKKKTIQEEAL
jgi:hypothetical protein